MTRRLWIVLGTAVLLALLVSGTAAAKEIANGTCGENVTWTLYDNGNLYIEGSGAMDNYPIEYPGYYDYRDQIKRILIYGEKYNEGTGVTAIGDYAFYELDEVEKVTIFGNTLQSVGGNAFRKCSAIKEPLDLPVSVTAIGKNAFTDCTALPDVGVLNPNAAFGQNVFQNCSASLTGWPNSTAKTYAQEAGVTFRQMDDCGYCGSSVIWTIFPAQRKLTIVGSGNMKNYASENAIPWYRAQDAIYSVEIEYGVKSIGDYAFYDCEYISQITIPASVTAIGKLSFHSTALPSITFPDSVTDIGEKAFHNCQSLVQVELPRCLANVGDGAFSYCYKLRYVYCYCGTTVFGEDVFYWHHSNFYLFGWPDSTAKDYAAANKLTFKEMSVPEPKFFLPADTAAIEDSAFSGIAARSVVIPKNITRITGNPFAGSKVVFIYGYAGTCAETLAQDYGYSFIAVDDAWMTSHGR